MSVPVAPSAETALQLFQNTLHVLGWVLLGAALIAIGLYLAFLGSETLIDNLPQKTALHRRAGTVSAEKDRDAATELLLAARPKDQNIVEMPAARPDARQSGRVRTRAQRG